MVTPSTELSFDNRDNVALMSFPDSKSNDVDAKIQQELPKNPTLPFNYPVSRKWLITLVAGSNTLLFGLNATAFTVVADTIASLYNISDDKFPNSYWPVTSWNMGAALGTILILPLMENFGTRYFYLCSYIGFLLFLIPQALAQNFATLVVTRFFAGAFGSIVQNAIGNIIGDVWETEAEKSIPVTLYVITYLVGVTLGPVFGAAIITSLSWRWIFWIQLIINGALFPLTFYSITETRESVILAKQARKNTVPSPAPVPGQTNDPTPLSFSSIFLDSIVRPAQLFFTEPVLFFFGIWAALAIGNIFLATQSIPQVYALYDFTDIQVGLVQAGMVVGELLGAIGCIMQNNIYLRSARLHGGQGVPEARLQLSIPASLVGFAGGLFWYAWTSYRRLHWIMPTIGVALMGAGSSIVVSCAATYLADAYMTYAGSAFAAVTFWENCMSGFLPLAALSMYGKLGLHWASSLLGFVALVLTIAPVVLVVKGKSIRARSKFMSSQ